MEKDNFFKNSFFLTASNITTGLLGFIFSIYLSKLIGAEGIGLYGIIMPIYNLFICLMTAGIIAAISKLSAIYTSKGETNNLFKTINSVAIFNIIWSLFIGIFVFFLAPYISRYGVKDLRTLNAIRVTCPAMVFISLSNILKGYFYGTSKITAPALIDILEKAMRIITISLLVYMFKAKTLSTLVALAFVSLAIGELQSLILLYIYYRHVIKSIPISNASTESRGQLLFNVFVISIPLCINGFLTNIFSTITTLVVPRRLVAAGFEYSIALSMLGRFVGMSLTIVTFPIIVVNSINMLLVPDLSESLSRGEYYNASMRIKKVLKIAFLLGMATMIICQLIPDDLGILFYGRNDLGLYIKVCSIAAPILFPANTMFGILNGLNKQGIILRNSLIISTFELVMLFCLTSIPNINIFSYAITIFFSSILSFTINIMEIQKHIDLNLSKMNILIFSLLGILIFLIFRIIINSLQMYSSLIKVIVTVIGVFAIFAYLSTFGLEDD